MPQQRLTPPVQSGQSTSVPPRSKITARGACINRSPIHKSLSCTVSLQTLVYHMISNLILCFRLFLSGLQRPTTRQSHLLCYESYYAHSSIVRAITLWSPHRRQVN